MILHLGVSTLCSVPGDLQYVGKQLRQKLLISSANLDEWHDLMNLSIFIWKIEIMPTSLGYFEY